MESKHKNALIGALLAVVFVMAVGYAAFAQQLTINGTAEITSSWDVHFDPDYTGKTAVSGTEEVPVVPAVGLSGATAPDGSITYSQNNQVATISATLIQPGDTVTFTMRPKNYGNNLNAKGTMTVSGTNGATCTGNVCTKGYIKFTVTPTLSNSLAPNASDKIVVVAEYTNPDTNATDTVQDTAGITVGLNYVQA